MIFCVNCSKHICFRLVLKKKRFTFFVTATPPSDIIDKAYAYKSGFILHY